MRSGRGAREQGFSYIEVLVGIAVLAIVAGGVVQGLAGAGDLLGSARVDSTAAKIASAQADRVHGMPYDDVGIQGGSPPGAIPASREEEVDGIAYRVETEVVYVDDPAPGQPRTYADYKRVTVTATPATDGGRAQTRTTLVAPPAIGAIAGRAAVLVTVVDAMSADPVAGASVTVDGSTSPPQTQVTGDDGAVVFAGLEPSALDPSDPGHEYRVSVDAGESWQVHPDDLEDASRHLAASQTWPVTMRVFRPATIVANLRDAATGELIGQPAAAELTAPDPDGRSEARAAVDGVVRFEELEGAPIVPSGSGFRIDAWADCHAPGSASGPAPDGYPGVTTHVFDVALERLAGGDLDVVVADADTGEPVPEAVVELSGGDEGFGPEERPTDESGVARWCVEPSGDTAHLVRAGAPGYGAGSVQAVVRDGERTTVQMRLVRSATGTVRLTTLGGGRLVRLRALHGTYDASQVTSGLLIGRADFTGLAAGEYLAYIATGTSGGEPTWSSGKRVTARSGTTSSYSVP